MKGVLRKVKRPQGTHAYEYAASYADDFGHWLYLPRGATWTAPHDCGMLPFDALALLAPTRPTVAWWCYDTAGRRIEVDVCIPPVVNSAGWTFVDLELDVTLHGDGTPVVEDEDEFADACHAGYIDEATAALAEAATADIVQLLRFREEPFGEAGWQRLADFVEQLRGE